MYVVFSTFSAAINFYISGTNISQLPTSYVSGIKEDTSDVCVLFCRPYDAQHCGKGKGITLICLLFEEFPLHPIWAKFCEHLYFPILPIYSQTKTENHLFSLPSHSVCKRLLQFLDFLNIPRYHSDHSGSSRSSNKSLQHSPQTPTPAERKESNDSGIEQEHQEHYLQHDSAKHSSFLNIWQEKLTKAKLTKCLVQWRNGRTRKGLHSINSPFLLYKQIYDNACLHIFNHPEESDVKEDFLVLTMVKGI
ncbi:hypothetical protein FF38_04177 [Lucilia cuprina]|uniref:Uncharacterized protein n=1 Tax=Lucilia cuprina TaxID=7375 RepID=A0A0L0BTE0_LUCCU|nr:hypothetical protein FF38_04177 [Lucilia cuprina]